MSKLRQLRNINRFPFGIRQAPDHCIPASVESVNKYLKPESTLTQHDIMNEFNRRKGPTVGLGLESIKDYAIRGNPAFSWADPRYISADFQTIVGTVRTSIEDDLPHIISVYGGTSTIGVQHWHMLTVVAYDETSFQVHDTETLPWGQNPRQVLLADIRLGLLQAHPLTDSTDSLVLRRL